MLFLLATALPCGGATYAAARDAGAAQVARAAPADATSRTQQSGGAQKSRAAATSAIQKTARAAATGTAAGRRAAGGGASRTRAAAGAAIISAPSARQSGVRARAATTAPATAMRARAAAADAVETPAPAASTRTGAAYEKCKSGYFTCMDQFCAVKNEKYRRCSCSDKIYELDEQQQVLESAADKINDFNAGLDAVGKTAAQAAAMRAASEGELAMEGDNSAGKRLLNAIMNSISGSGETKVAGGTLEKLNSVGFDSNSNLFTADANGQQMASYNGKTLYTAIYGQCRDVVRENCSDAALQRAVTAYLMAIENDCGTVSKMIGDNRKKMTSAAKESGAMLELARVDDRQNRNSADATECLNAVEAAIKDEQVCGENYKKCLDNGEYIDKETGKPFSGVENFVELTELLKFDKNASLADQKLTQNPANRKFIDNFAQRNKKFAEPALGKCAELADTVWSDYLDKALLDIHYAQQAKVEEIRRGCIDFVKECYVSNKKSITDFMQNLINPSSMALQPGQIQLTSNLCESYVSSCNNMFGGNMVTEYVKTVNEKDIRTTCRNIAKECFISYGGDKYSNFYNPASGLFRAGEAFDWFSLYGTLGKEKKGIVSPCAQKLIEIPECSNSATLLEEIFGGFDKLSANDPGTGTSCYEYGMINEKNREAAITCKANDENYILKHISQDNMRQMGVATEIYNEVVGVLQQNCRNLNGYFLEYRYLNSNNYCIRTNLLCTESGVGNYNKGADPQPELPPNVSPCTATFKYTRSTYSAIADDYNFDYFEDICPISYQNVVDINSWGICSCWANGGRRVKEGSIGCEVYIPNETYGLSSGEKIWGHTEVFTNSAGQVCPSTVATSGGETRCECPLWVKQNGGNCIEE